MYRFLPLLLVLSSCTGDPAAATTGKKPTRPNIIFILADDLGLGEIGALGQQKIETPNLDALATGGMVFIQHYTGAPVCAPARCMLLTGKHAGHAYVRGNDEWRERGDVWNYYAMARDSSLEGQRPLPDSVSTVADYLQEAGYQTGMVGKWGLGAPHTNSVPNDKGFDYFYGYNCQRQAHTHTPLFLYENRHRVPLNNDTVPPSTKLAEGADPNAAASYAAYTQPDYAPELMAEKMLGFVEQQGKNPFFLYWATPIPHVPLQAPGKWVDHYVEKFGPEEPYLGQRGYFPNQYPRAAYAAMVSYFDENVGRLVKQLKHQGIYENTLIVFSSDNGPSYAGGTDSPWFDSGGPFASEYGRGKGFVYEGGIRVPTLASWPGKIAPGTTTDLPSTHYDFWATVTELIDGPPIETDGLSYLPTLLDEGEQEKHNFLYWEFPESGGQLAIRMGDWKLVRQHLKDKQEPTLELYNLAEDPIEMNNVAEQYPEIVGQAAEILEREHTETIIDQWRMPGLKKGLVEGYESRR